MKLTGTFALRAAVNPTQRRIVGTAVPFNVEGFPGYGGYGIRLVVEAGGVVVDPDNMPKLRLGHHERPIGRAVTWDDGPDGVMAAFKVAQTATGDEALTLAADGLVPGLSIEADVPDDFEPDAEGVFRLTAANPATVSAVALVEVPAFSDAQVTDVAAQKAGTTMPNADTVAAAEVPDDQLSTAVDAITSAADALRSFLPAGDPAADAPADQAAASRPASVPALTAQTVVTREPFPYGHAGAEGRSFFRDIVAAQTADAPGRVEAAQRAAKANAMLAEHARNRARVPGRNLLAGDPEPSTMTATEAAIRALLTAANEPVTRSTLLIPNVYDMEHYAAQLRFPRVIADQVPGVPIEDPRPRVVPTFTSSVADGGTGEPVIASTEGSNPAQAELNIGSATVTPVWYHGMYDIARQALDAGGPETDVLCFAGLYESYAQVTETAAVTAILANGTAGTDVATNADTVDVEPRSALKSIRTQLGAFYANRGAPADAVLYASDVYQAALGADGTDGRPLYAFLSDRMQVVNAAGAADAPGAMALNVYGVPGQLAFKLTATKFVIAKWADMIRYESPTYEFRLLEPVAPASIRLAVGGYFAQRTLQAKGARYFSQL